MSDLCHQIDAYLDGLLEGERQAAFERHLEDCVECRAAVESWQHIAPVLSELGQNASRLVRRAEVRHDRSLRLRWVVGLAAAIGAVAILGGVLLALDEDRGERETGGPAPRAVASEPLAAEVLVPRTAEGVLTLTTGALIEASGSDRLLVRIGEDLIGLAPGSRVRALEIGDDIRLGLERGAVACSVEPRRSGQSFAVAVGPAEVRVVGTRFVVSTEDGSALEVAVSEGEVEVIAPQGTPGKVVAGQSLARVSGADFSIREIDAAQQELLTGLLTVEPIAPVEPPATDDAGSGALDNGAPRAAATAGDGAPTKGESTDAESAGGGGLAQWRAWIKEGRLAEAERALVGHLDGEPGDHRAWSLLASCRRKRGDWSGAHDAHRRVIDLAPAGQANRARFMAASILQDRLGDPSGAARLLQDYLDVGGGGSLAAEAMVRLARCHLALGRPGPAERLLERVVRDHGGTTMATEARRLLADLGSAGDGEHGEEADK